MEKGSQGVVDVVVTVGARWYVAVSVMRLERRVCGAPTRPNARIVGEWTDRGPTTGDPALRRPTLSAEVCVVSVDSGPDPLVCVSRWPGEALLGPGLYQDENGRETREVRPWPSILLLQDPGRELVRLRAEGFSTHRLDTRSPVHMRV